MYSLPEISIRRPVFAWMMMVAIVAFGWMSYKKLGIGEMPDVDYPVLTVTTRWEGASPEIIEADVVDRLEEAISSLEGVKEISSNIKKSVGSTTIYYDISQDINVALQELQAKIIQVKMPAEVDPSVITKSNPDDRALIWIGVKSSREKKDLLKIIDETVVNQLQKIPGVGALHFSGFAERSMRVWVDSDKLKKYELTILDIKRAIENGHREASAGKIENNDYEFNLRVLGEALTPEDLGKVLIDTRGGRPIYDKAIRIGDVARVEDGLNDTENIVRVSGIPGISIGVKKRRGENSVEVGRLVKKTVKQLSNRIPSDITLNIVYDGTQFIEESIEEAKFTLILSALATAFVCWLFLGSIAPTANILLSIPTSLFGTLFVIEKMGFTLNFFTILGLTLAIGIVVDDAIMVLENIYRHRDMGKNKVKASLDGAREITFAAFSASIAVVAIFLPVSFIDGVLGKFIFQFGVTISCAVLFSLFESLTLTPMRCSQVMEKPHEANYWASLLEQFYSSILLSYRRILRFCLKWRVIVIVLSALCFIISLSLIQILKKEFVPTQDQSAFAIKIYTPVGTSLLKTDQKLLEVEKFLRSRPEIVRYVAIAGDGGAHIGSTYLTLTPKEHRAYSQQELIDIFRTELQKISDIKVIPIDYSASSIISTGGAPVEFNIRGPEWRVLKENVFKITDKLIESHLVQDVSNDYREGMPEVRIWPIREIASERGVSIDTIGQTINAAIGGVRAGKFTNDGHRYDLRIRLNANERQIPEDILKLEVRNSYGELVPLKDMIRLESTTSLKSIIRKDRERSISVSANLAPGRSQAEVLEAVKRLAAELVTGDYKLFLESSAASFIESMNSLVFVLYLGTFIAYMILASQFNSITHPIIVLMALPFSITGALVALYLGNQSINLYSMIGILLLMGITKKNSILLVEFANTVRTQGNVSLTVNEALLLSAPIRLRPILMTTCATIAAALPPALAIGPGAESRIPMAIAILGGIIVSTLFTLVVVPCGYSLICGKNTSLIRSEKD